VVIVPGDGTGHQVVQRRLFGAAARQVDVAEADEPAAVTVSAR